MKNRVVSLVGALFLLLSATQLLAASSQPVSAVSSGGGSAGGTTGQTLLSTLGQSTAIGTSTNTNFVNQAGFIPALAASGYAPAAPVYTLTFNAGDHGTISGDTPQNVTQGGDATEVFVIPDAGYSFARWNGDYNGTANPLVVTNIQSSMTITATYTLIDTDGDGVADLNDPFPNNANEWKDTDGDGVPDNQDNCPTVYNPGTPQTDTDHDAMGDACDSKPSTANYGSVIDAPHNGTRGITCGSCHTYSLWWKYSPVTTAAANYATITNAICAKCHNTVTHSSVTPGDFSVKCVECHSAHHQAQVDWRGSDANNLYLVKGTITGSFVVNGGQTTLNYSLTSSMSEWSDTATWGKKNSTLPPKGLILVVDTTNATNTYEVLSATPTQITIKGGIDPNKAGKSFGLVYGQMIKKSITTPTQGTKSVKFFNPKAPNGGYTNSTNPPSGICQVCHASTTMSWNSSGSGSNPTHDSGLNCTECHRMAQGFKP